MRRSSTTRWWLGALMLLALGLGAYALFRRQQRAPISPTQEAVPPAQMPGTPEALTSPELAPTPPESVPGTTLPPLAESDAVMRELAAGSRRIPRCRAGCPTNG